MHIRRKGGPDEGTPLITALPAPETDSDQEGLFFEKWIFHRYQTEKRYSISPYVTLQ